MKWTGASRATLRTVGIFAASAVVVLMVACGGGGSNPSPTAPPPPPPPPAPTEGIFFTADGIPAGSTIYLEGQDTEDTTSSFVIEVRANDVEDLYGVSFDLQYPSDLLTWRRGKFEEGTFLSTGGAETEILIDRRPAGNLVVGITRVGDAEGVSGSGLLLSLEFVNEAIVGAGVFSFSDNDLVDSFGGIQEGSQWLAGSIESKID
jgi:hypothetical protein